MSDLDLLALELATCLVMAAPRRFTRENSPGAAPGPRVMAAGCAEGNVAGVRADLDDAVAARALDLVGQAPAWTASDGPPDWAADVAMLVGADPATLGGGPCFLLPNGLGFDHPAQIVAGETAEGAAMLARFEREGMPKSLVEAGYVDTGELWPPWCAAIVADEVAALCCAARLGGRGAEAGLYTFPPFRGQGYGAAVTAAWSQLPSLAGKTLFYSTQWSNRSSLAVTRRLGLRRIGATVRIG